MGIHLLKEIFIDSNDVYVLESLQKTILVNDNYSGIKLYDYNLESRGSIKIFDGILIHTVYKSPNKNAVILYCPDNEVFVYLDLDKSHQQVIDFIGGIDECGLSSFYYWSGDEVLLLSGNKKFYRIRIGLFELQELSIAEVREHYPIFYNKVNKFGIFLVFEFETTTITYGDGSNRELIFYDSPSDRMIRSAMPNELGHEIMYLNGMFLSVHENFIEAIDDGKVVARIEAISPYAYLKARKRNEKDMNFIVLSGNKSNTKECYLSHYEITY